MRQASEMTRPLSVDDPTAVGEQTCTFIRKLHPRATAENVAADLKSWRVKAATIAKMLERGSAPSANLLLALTYVYGPEFLCAVMKSPPDWLDAASRAHKQAELRAQVAALTEQLERL